MKLNRAGVAAGLLAAAVALAACGSDGNDAGSSDSNTPAATTSGGATTSDSASAAAPTCSKGTLDAEGSTAQKNAFDAWATAYQKACSGATVNYNASGSGTGISQFTAGKVDFAGSDSPLNPDASPSEVTAAKTACGSAPVDLPMVVGPIALGFKLNGVDKLTLNGPVTAKIFAGKITKWNDSAIAALNSGVTLPSTKISVFYRSDSSGTTQNFEKYLAATAPSDFTSTPDKDSSKAGFTGQGKTGSQGVADALGTTEGSIGYVEYSFVVAASSQGVKAAAINNGGGSVALTKDTASKAAEAATVASNGGADDLSLKLDYATKTAGAYPLILVTYEIVCSKYKDATTGTFVKNFLTYTSGSGQSLLPALGYAPLPSSLQTKVAATVAKLS